jgi:hypothetical protein
VNDLPHNTASKPTRIVPMINHRMNLKTGKIIIDGSALQRLELLLSVENYGKCVRLTGALPSLTKVGLACQKTENVAVVAVGGGVQVKLHS